MKRVLCIFVLMVLLLGTYGCNKTKPTVTDKENIPEGATSNNSTDIKVIEKEGFVTPSPMPTQEVKQEDNPQFIKDFVFPDEGVRPYAVMIDNDNSGNRILPQGGIKQAQLVYEIVVEGGISRIMPVFWGTAPELIGPVRSSRHYFLDYAIEYDAIYVHFGGSPQAMADITKFKINNINGVGKGGGIFWDLTKNKSNWQDSYTSKDKIEGYINKAGYKTTTKKVFPFSYNIKDVDLSGDDIVNEIVIDYDNDSSMDNRCGYYYDEELKAYKRLHEGKPHMERNTNEQVIVKNIIILEVNNYTIKGDTSGRQELLTTGNGNGWYITNGKRVPIKWSKPTRTSNTTYTFKDGGGLKLNVGQTWIQIVSPNIKMIIQ